MKSENACHSQSCHHRASQGKRALKLATLIALVFMAIETLGGIVADSLALISDALHMFADVGSLLLGWMIIKITERPSTPRFSYGFKRAEVLGALASTLILWILCAMLIYESILRLLHPAEVEGKVVLIIAAFGLAANLAMVRLLHPTKGHNLNMQAAYLHVLGDLLGGIGVLLGGALIWITGWSPIDPIISILFSLGILYSSGKVMQHSLYVLMESTPAHLNPQAIQLDLANLPGISEVHDLHIWSVSSDKSALSVHLVAKDPRETLNAAQQLLEKRYAIQHMTIQVEDHEHFHPRYCYDCHR